MRFVTPTALNSLSLRVLGAYLVGVVLSILLIGLGLTALLTFHTEVVEKRASIQASKLATRLMFSTDGAPIGLRSIEHEADWIYQSFKDELAYRVLDASGQVILYSPAGESFWTSSGLTTLHLTRGHFVFEREGVAIHAATEPVQHQGRTWYIQYALSARAADLFQTEFALPFMGRGIALFSITLMIVFGACAYVTIRRTFEPLRELSASASAISPHSLHARLRPEGVPAEVAPLVQSFNQALERLEHGYRGQQEFLAAAAHELKTPLALIRAQIELNEFSAHRASLLQDVEHMTRQVQQLLLLAEVREVQNYHFESIDILDVTQEVSSYLQRMAQGAGVWVNLQPNASRPSWLADRGALFTLLKNLLENAIQHAPRGSGIYVDATATELTVRDWGPGADEDTLSRIFVRFWRGPHRRDKGAGLGLAICQEIAQAHGWTLTAEQADPGLRFVLSRNGPQQNAPV
ncbi:HAMP domain-containing protein [Variovorax gossypii]|uniref:histidine kinase n=1 Tax=Variovorax gossypii TaxID=1679495 RepID=A0A431TPE8_9BURK|nr:MULTISPECIES: ATP-binding protein [Variovorax]MDR6522087.1 signal transduction histidine kinase [Variovorax paradoxus]RTQ35604.1 HAMP domain-containing protein [Variovorax gossypii]